MCNEGYYINFRSDGVPTYNYAENAISKGRQDLNTGLWRINFFPDKPQLTIAAANNVNELRNAGALVNYLQKSMFSPTKSGLLQAVKNGHLTT
jgi:hypothetical protein